MFCWGVRIGQSHERADLLYGDGVSQSPILNRALDKALERIKETQSIDEKAHALWRVEGDQYKSDHNFRHIPYAHPADVA